MQNKNGENKGMIMSYLRDPGNRSALKVLGGLGVMACSGGNPLAIGVGAVLSIGGLLENPDKQISRGTKVNRVNLK